ncbi:MAG: glycosyltransferase family 4 protein [Peptococcaceae bacterium]|nr:glycosyltransferase family 4 protein [Peptococcaceae bacterium]
MARIKVLQVITLSGLGGAQKVVYHLAAGLSRELFEITVACAPGGELVDWLEKLPRDVRVFEIPELRRNISPLNDLIVFWKLFSFIKKKGFQIVHCHSSKAGVLGRLAARLAGGPKIFFTVHGWGINEYQGRPARLFYTWAERLAGAVSTKVVCVSQSDLAKGRSLGLAPDGRLCVIYNGLPEPEKREGALRGELGIKKDDIIIGTVARLAPQKDPLFLLEVARRLAACFERGPGKGSLYFVIIGDGPLRGECEAFIREHGLAGRVFLLGAREDAASLMPDFDVFALFSRWEGLPLTIIEAMLAGVPVVASDVGGVGELVVGGETGYLIEGLDPQAAERALVRLLADGDLRRRMGEAGRKRAREKFSLAEMLRRYRELYLE